MAEQWNVKSGDGGSIALWVEGDGPSLRGPGRGCAEPNVRRWPSCSRGFRSIEDCSSSAVQLQLQEPLAAAAVGKSWLSAARLTKINSSDPPLTPSARRTRPHHSCRSFTHQSSWSAFDQVADSTCCSIGSATYGYLSRGHARSH
jgi:hypothetical protein